MQELTRISAGITAQPRIRVLQFGAGNFLRAFFDWMVQVLNEEAGFDGGVLVVKPTDRGNYDRLKRQDGLYHVILNGVQEGKVVSTRKLVSCLNQFVNPYHEWDQYLASAQNPFTRFVVSNTTEAGIAFSEKDRFEDCPPKEFPAKLTQWLYERFNHFRGDARSGCVLLPCELIEENGDTLKACILQYSDRWKLADGFTDWIQDHNYFYNTLVDRIVSGYPHDRAQEIAQESNLQDEFLVAGEMYHSWILEGPPVLPMGMDFSRTGLNVSFVKDLRPYREIKVRVLNGAHTAMVPVGILLGLTTVEEVMKHEQAMAFLGPLLGDEVLPCLNLPQEAKQLYVRDTFDRFRNPHLKHQLKSIALNSVSKFRSRLVPTLEDYYSKKGQIPIRIAFSLGALIYLYTRSNEGIDFAPQEDPDVLALFAPLSNPDQEDESWLERLKILLANPMLWGKDLTMIPGLVTRTSQTILDIQRMGMVKALPI